MRTLSLFATIALASAGFAPSPAQDPPETAVRGGKRFRRSVVASGLENPWEIASGPDGWLWTTERTGKRVTRVNPANGERRTAIVIEEASTPGGQDGLLGMALHPGLLQGAGEDFVYVYYTYEDRERGPDPNAAGQSPYRFLYGKVVRLSYNKDDGALSGPVELLSGLPAGNDHNAGRLKFGPDQKLYLAIGDMGHNQFSNYCLPIESRRLPTQAEIDRGDYSAYVGKTLRLNLDGSIPDDNPRIAGVRSHVYTYGHRNPQGLGFAPGGTLYSAEHGPKTDDEINILQPGGDYGWPNVAGFRDGMAYEYARWAEASEPCESLQYADPEVHPSVPRSQESDFTEPFIEPLATLFTVGDDFNFRDPACKGIDFICWPTVGISSVEHYQAGETGIPGWERVLLAAALKRGSLYVIPLSEDGRTVAGPIKRYFQSENRYRDTAVSPGGRAIYIATDVGGLAEALAGGPATAMQDPGAILAFTYEGEGEAPSEPRRITRAGKPPERKRPAAAGLPPRFTEEQVAAGKRAYEAHCAVCHGAALTNGVYGTPLAGEYFQDKWSGATVQALFEHARTMPPSKPGTLSDKVYAALVAYVMHFNGVDPGEDPLPAEPQKLNGMTIP